VSPRAQAPDAASPKLPTPLLVDTQLLWWAAFEPDRLSLHRDPFDRLLVAQALEEDHALLTADATLVGYGPFVHPV
jgi:PIN domain nuclease of toxin-antitoxin system